MLSNSYQLAQDFWEYIPAMTITDCCYFPLCLSYWCCPMICEDRRKFRSQISDNMDRWKAEMGRVREEKRREEERRSNQDQSRESQKKEDPGARKKVGKSRNIVFPMWLRMVESRLAKAAGAEPAGQMRYEKLHAVVARSACPSQNARNTPSLEHFLKLRCGKSARVVARSTFPSQNVQNTPGSEHFLKLRCRKSARVVARSTFPSQNVQYTPGSNGSWDVEKARPAVARRAFPSQNVQNPSCSEHFCKFRFQKKCTPLWRKAHFQVKMFKALHVPSTFGGWDVERVHAAVTRRAFPS